MISVSTVTASNPAGDCRLGFGTVGGLEYTAGSPNFAGQLGRLTAELDPAQFVGVTTGRVGWNCTGPGPFSISNYTITITLYR